MTESVKAQNTLINIFAGKEGDYEYEEGNGG
jgi:hypothetical protein